MCNKLSETFLYMDSIRLWLANLADSKFKQMHCTEHECACIGDEQNMCEKWILEFVVQRLLLLMWNISYRWLSWYSFHLKFIKFLESIAFYQTLMIITIMLMLTSWNGAKYSMKKNAGNDGEKMGAFAIETMVNVRLSTGACRLCESSQTHFAARIPGSE